MHKKIDHEVLINNVKLPLDLKYDDFDEDDEEGFEEEEESLDYFVHIRSEIFKNHITPGLLDSGVPLTKNEKDLDVLTSTIKQLISIVGDYYSKNRLDDEYAEFIDRVLVSQTVLSIEQLTDYKYKHLKNGYATLSQYLNDYEPIRMKKREEEHRILVEEGKSRMEMFKSLYKESK